ncbi:MAG: KpsF/GutQ family sugar-phosphate isomerase [Nitrospirae bacterium]|nr:MAG: KpsF/GutQ family sugar-phosphate isomerase [Nitrospirota bacterium]
MPSDPTCPADTVAIGRRVLEIEAEAIRAMGRRMGEPFTRAVERILACDGKVVVTGMGKSGLVGKKICATLASTGTPAIFLHPAEGIHGDFGMVTRGDVVIAISNSGETEEVVRLIPMIERMGCPLIAMTGGLDSTLARSAEVTLDVGVEREACNLNIVPTASTTATLAMGDALAVALLERRNFRPEDFAQFHPGGALGRRLFVKVADLMHTGEELPVVPSGCTLKEALLEMTAKKLGVTTVVGPDGRLAGILTDGDLRRALERSGNPLERPVDEFMGRNPRTIEADALAALAVARMEERKITSLVITDEERRPVGLLHLHDCLKAKIV